MSASAGDFVTPGTRVSVNENFSLGDGIISTESGHLALLSGKLVEENGVISIISDSNVNMPKVGDIVIGQVSRLNAKTAEIRILHIEGKEEGERDIPTLKLFADIYVTDFVDQESITTYQSLIGMLQWAVTLGWIDIHQAVMTMSCFSSKPHQGHLDRVKRIFS